jgi:hypothetical protein
MKFPQLNLPPFEIKIRENLIWDRLRKKFVRLTPEEWVRQHLINYLIEHLHYPAGRTVSEYTVDYNSMKKRCDILIFDENGLPFLVVECKAPEIKISEDTFYQAARYASSLKIKWILLSNGVDHFCAQINQTDGHLNFRPEIPAYQKS